MNAHTRKTHDAIMQGRAPRDLEWTQFVALWNELADDVQIESGDRLVVHLNGHRDVFHRQHDARVGLQDIERARRLLTEATPELDAGQLVVVTIDAERARIIVFGLGDGRTTEDESRTIDDPVTASRRLRTVERRRGRDDIRDLSRFFDDVAAALASTSPELAVVVLGDGHGKADDAGAFAARVRAHHEALRDRLHGIGRIDLGSATDADLAAAARAVIAA
jgi:hypothetical protein